MADDKVMTPSSPMPVIRVFHLVMTVSSTGVVHFVLKCSDTS